MSSMYMYVHVHVLKNRFLPHKSYVGGDDVTGCDVMGLSSLTCGRHMDVVYGYVDVVYGACTVVIRR